MINMPAVLVANGIGVLILFSIILNARFKLQHCLLEEKVFYTMIFLNLIQCVLETGTFLVDGEIFPGCRVVSLLMNSVLFSNNIIFALLWTVFVDLKLFSDKKRIERRLRCLGVPAALIVAGTVINLFVPVFFSVSADNIYQRTSLYIIPYIATYFYLIFGTVQVYRYRKQVGRYLFLPAILFMIPVFVGSALQWAFYGLSLVWVGVAVGLLSIYINVQNEVSSTDMISGLFTRQYMHQYLRAIIRGLEEDKQIAGIMLDIDQFKSVNDTFGHLTGDEAIMEAGGILRNAVQSNGIAVRFAGDEFMILVTVRDESEIENILARVDRITEQFNTDGGRPYTLHFSKGWGTYDRRNDTVDTFLDRIDKQMYEDKRSHAGEREKTEQPENKMCGVH